jgi:glucose-1-phosphate adenylyltransferase
VRRIVGLVLAGGGGEALSVLTTERAVSAVPFGGKYRVIDFVLSNCCHSEIDGIGVLSQHAPASLHDHIGAGRPWGFDHRDGGVLMLQPYLTRSDTDWYQGTAHAIARNWNLIEDLGVSRVLVLSGDQVYRMDYRRMLMLHERRGATVTLAVTRVPREESCRFGMVKFGPDGRVTALEEKPRRTQATHASMGVYLFETAALGELLRDRPADLVEDVIVPLLEAGESVHAHEFTGYWEDVGTVASYYRSNLELIAPAPRLELHNPRWPVLTRDEERPPVSLREQADVEESLIANGCRVCGRVRRSVLFPGVVVAPGAEITDSIVLQDVIVGRDAKVDRAILDKHAEVGERATVGWGEAPGDPAHAWLGGLTLVGKDACVPAGARVGRGVVIGIHASFDGQQEEIFVGSTLPSRVWYEGVVG